MTDRELMQMSLGRFEKIAEGCEFVQQEKKIHADAKNLAVLVSKDCSDLIKTLRERLSQPDWVGLTDLEIIDIAESTCLYGSDNHYEVIEFVASIEKKLQEKNV